MLPVPASPFVRIIAAPLADPRSASPRLGAPRQRHGGQATCPRGEEEARGRVGRRTRRCRRPRAPRGSSASTVTVAALRHHRIVTASSISRRSGIRHSAPRLHRGGCPPARVKRHDRAAPASSAIRACSASTTSMMTPPLSISARTVLTRGCTVLGHGKSLARRPRGAPAAPCTPPVERCHGVCRFCGNRTVESSGDR